LAPNVFTRKYRGSIRPSNKEAAYELASQIEAGTVWIDKHFDILPYVPSGGAKNSGLGRELGEEGLAELTPLQVINTAV
jgi:acyl-CoA reductase-like NAD-dependent aldehyde dehydrogenase